MTVARLVRGDGDRLFLVVVAALFVVSVTATIVMCVSMSLSPSTTALDPMPMSMPMPGGWTMSALWRPMCGQTWAGVAASFIGMWTVMTMAMMLPSLTPMLWRYRRALTQSAAALRLIGPRRIDSLVALVGAGYFAVWIALGGVVFAAGVALTALAMRHAALSRGVPFAAGIVVLAAGALQFSRWKARRLACCRHASDRAPPASASAGSSVASADARSAWRHGVRLGLHCCDCCAGFTAILLVSGVMDWRVMAAVTLAISAERLLPRGERIAWASGVVAVGVGLLSVAQAAGLG
nr:hypothetical protein HUO10_006626 [Paraburkholderia busanensis]